MPEPIPFAELSPANQAFIRAQHRPGLTWLYDPHLDDPTLAPTILATRDLGQFLAYLTALGDTAATLRCVRLPEDLEVCNAR